MNTPEQLNPLIVKGPAAHRVYQREEHNKAAIPFELVSLQAMGIVEARVVAEDSPSPWQYMGVSEGDTFIGTINSIEIGKYRLDFRVGGESALTYCSIEPVFVGDLWILAGQSNMEGCGQLVDVDQPEVGISCFYMSDRWDVAHDPLCWPNESVDPVHWRIAEVDLPLAIRQERRDRAKGAGLGIPFAKELRKHMNIPIGLIMCAHGGTSMAQWDPALADLAGCSLYGAMLRKIKKLGGKVKGCLWYQGEGETFEDSAPLYVERMKNWVANLRHDIGDPELPFIYAQLSVFFVLEPDERWPYPDLWDQIQQDQLALESHISNSAMVPTIDAKLADAIHVDTSSLRAIGRRMAWQALKLAYKQPVCHPGPRPVHFSWNQDRSELVISLAGINGKLSAVDKVFGFRVGKGGQIFGHLATLTEDRQKIRIVFEQTVPAESQLQHGAGFNPTVNVKDGMGIPLVVFGPITL
ncbi:sialate O-acetylesterase [Cohnella soli]|uniref:Sialate O-acetylesterase n=1 Tax=Cohnella soli TaxID=425005 RepID=A0ABW0HWD7_9BACL